MISSRLSGLWSAVLYTDMYWGGWQQIIPGLSRSTNYITMSMGYYTDKILANYICQLHWQKTQRLYPGAGDSGPFWWEIWAENDPSQPPVFRCSENTNILAAQCPMFADWTSCFGPDVFLLLTVGNVLSRPMKAGTMAERLKNTD